MINEVGVEMAEIEKQTEVERGIKQIKGASGGAYFTALSFVVNTGNKGAKPIICCPESRTQKTLAPSSKAR